MDRLQSMLSRVRLPLTVSCSSTSAPTAWARCKVCLRLFVASSSQPSSRFAVLLDFTDPHAVPLLIDVLDNTKQQVMVRHEAAEALGAIAAPNVLDVLRKYEHDETVEVAETCQIAIQRVEWVMAQKAEAAGAPDPYAPSCSISHQFHTHTHTHTQTLLECRSGATLRKGR